MTTRRTLLALSAGMIPLGALSAKATAAPMAKEAVGYQDVPCDGKLCAQCVYFMFHPAAGSEPASRCQLVAGPISPAGWCEIWAPR
jgi:hypothetical protein